jgi:hypothetical protein
MKKKITLKRHKECRSSFILISQLDFPCLIIYQQFHLMCNLRMLVHHGRFRYERGVFFSCKATEMTSVDLQRRRHKCNCI